MKVGYRERGPKSSACEMCALAERRERTIVPGYGPGGAKLVIVGEAPGKDEVKAGKPFVGRSGKLLDSLLTKARVDRKEVYLTNALKCQMLGGMSARDLDIIGCCVGTLENELAKTAEDARILVLGGPARDALFPKLAGDSVTSRVGHWLDWHGKSALCSWHPAYVLRNPGSLRDLQMDVRRWGRGRTVPAPTVTLVLDQVDSVVAYLNDLDETRPVVIDLETHGLNPFKDDIVCASVTQQAGIAYVIPGKLLYDLQVQEAMLRYTWIGHNSKFDGKCLLAQIGLNLYFEFDTLLAHYTTDERGGQHKLKHLVIRLFDGVDYQQELLDKYEVKMSDSMGAIIAKGGLDDVYDYAGKDADYTWRLYQLFERVQGSEYFELLMDVSRMYTEIETRGIYVDQDSLEEAKQKFTQIMCDARWALSAKAGGSDVNPQSHQQMKRLLTKTFGFTLKNRGGKTPIDAEVLEALKMFDEHGVIELIQTYRKASKMRGMYTANILKNLEAAGDGRFHPDVSLHASRTGRLGSPVILLIPRAVGHFGYGKLIKSAFHATPGYTLGEADHSQLELRLLGWFSKDKFLRSVYESGGDLHGECAEAIYGRGYTSDERTRAKGTNFLWVYGGTVEGAARSLNEPVELIQAIFVKYEAIMPEACRWRAAQPKLAQKRGYLEIPGGQRRRWPLVTAANFADVRKQAMNSPIQMLGNIITFAGAVAVHKSEEFKGLGGHILVTMHDSIVFEAPTETFEECAEICRDEMLQAATKCVGNYPMQVDIASGQSWGEVE